MYSCFTGDHKNTSGKKRENNGGRITLSNNWTCNSFWQDRSVSSFKYFSTSRLKTIPFAVPNSIKRAINFGTVVFKQICRNNQTPIFIGFFTLKLILLYYATIANKSLPDNNQPNAGCIYLEDSNPLNCRHLNQNLKRFKNRKDSTNLKSINPAIGKLLCMESKHLKDNKDRMKGIFWLEFLDWPRSIWKACQKNLSPHALILHSVKTIINGIKCLFTWQVVIPELTHKENYVEGLEPFDFPCSKISRPRLSKSCFQVFDLTPFQFDQTSLIYKF